MTWGVFAQTDRVHVCPATICGAALVPHVLQDRCVCHPTIRTAMGEKPMVIHHDDH